MIKHDFLSSANVDAFPFSAMSSNSKNVFSSQPIKAAKIWPCWFVTGNAGNASGNLSIGDGCTEI